MRKLKFYLHLIQLLLIISFGMFAGLSTAKGLSNASNNDFNLEGVFIGQDILNLGKVAPHLNCANYTVNDTLCSYFYSGSHRSRYRGYLIQRQFVQLNKLEVISVSIQTSFESYNELLSFLSNKYGKPSCLVSNDVVLQVNLCIWSTKSTQLSISQNVFNKTNERNTKISVFLKSP